MDVTKLTANEIQTLIETLRTTNVLCWEIYAQYVPSDENTLLRKLLEMVITDTDAKLERLGVDPNFELSVP